VLEPLFRQVPEHRQISCHAFFHAQSAEGVIPQLFVVFVVAVALALPERI
jgi:hypothetical protein